MEYLLDTNVLIRHAQADEKVIAHLERLNRPYFFASAITYFELLCGCKNKTEEKKLKEYLQGMVILDLRQQTMDQALSFRDQKKTLKFKDLLIAATAQLEDLKLVTADKDFRGIKGLGVEWVH